MQMRGMEYLKITFNRVHQKSLLYQILSQLTPVQNSTHFAIRTCVHINIVFPSTTTIFQTVHFLRDFRPRRKLFVYPQYYSKS